MAAPLVLWAASSSGGDLLLLPKEESGFHSPAISAFERVDRKIAACSMLLDTGEVYWLAAFGTGVIH
jgi:hypothetical protein